MSFVFRLSLILAAVLFCAPHLTPLFYAAPIVTVIEIPGLGNPVWSKAVARELRNALDIDSTLATMGDPAETLRSLSYSLDRESLLGKGPKAIAETLKTDWLVYAEWLDAVPTHKVIRERWMPWKAAESWSLPIRIMLWDKTGRLVASTAIQGESTWKGIRFFPFTEFDELSLSEKDAFIRRRLNVTASQTSSYLASVIVGRKTDTAVAVPPPKK